MDLVNVSASQIVTVSRAAADVPGADFLCFGESDQRSPALAKTALIDALMAGQTYYPDVRGLPQLREALAGMLSHLHAYPVQESRIQVTASGMAAISAAVAATVQPGDRVVVHTPAWPNPGNAARLRGAVVEDMPLRMGVDGRYHMEMDRLAAQLVGARVFVLNSPNNPTGWMASHDDLAQILHVCRQNGVWLISDEVYSRLVYDDALAAPSVLDVARPDDKVIVCNSFSKSWAMTGWRVGWMVVPEGTRDIFADIVEVQHSGVAPFAQAGAVAAVADEAFVREFRAHCAQGRQIVTQALRDVPGVRYTPPVAAFYAWIGIEGMTDSLDFALHLAREHKVVVAPGSAFGPEGEGYLRVCFAQSPIMLERAMSRLRDGLRTRLG